MFPLLTADQVGVLFDMHKAHFGKDGDEILIWQADTRTMNPTVSESLERDISRKLAGDWLNKEALRLIIDRNLGNTSRGTQQDQTYPVGLGIARRENPEVDAQYQTGVVSDLSMKTIFRAWFKD
jgi:hypothetical protein